MIESMESKVLRYKGCINCMYRDYDIGYCWYTMTTNKTNYTNTPICKHFVDKDSALRRWKEMNKE